MTIKASDLKAGDYMRLGRDWVRIESATLSGKFIVLTMANGATLTADPWRYLVARKGA